MNHFLSPLPTIIVPEIHHIGMSSTILTFEDKYYEYGEKDIETKGLVIDRNEPAFLVDLVASYLFKKCSNQFKKFLWKGIYRDNGADTLRDLDRKSVV